MDLKELMSPDGYSIILKNYFRNMKQISESIQGYEDCSTPNQCGLYVGQMAKYLIGWSLNNPKNVHAGLETSTNDVTQLIKGLVNGLQSSPTSASQCITEVNAFLSNADVLVQDILDVIDAKTGALAKLLYDFSGTSKKFPDFMTICNAEGLVNQIEKLMSPDGMMIIMTHYMKNQGQITRDMQALEVCDTNYFNCGQAAGNMFKVMVGWSI